MRVAAEDLKLQNLPNRQTLDREVLCNRHVLAGMEEIEVRVDPGNAARVQMSEEMIEANCFR